MKIFLIGLPGSGKSTLGEELARQLGLQFIDLDAEIVKACGRSITAIFEVEGEAYFREREATALRNTIDKITDFVMATGGGSPCFHSGIDVMNTAGITVFLDVPVEVISGRLSADAKSLRPLLSSDVEINSLERLVKLREQRLKYYEQAAVVIRGSAITVEDIQGKVAGFNPRS